MSRDNSSAVLKASVAVADETVSQSQVALLDVLSDWQGLEVDHLKPEISPAALVHRQIREGEFWRHIPAYREISTETFLDHSWQARQSVTNPQRLRAALGERVPESFYQDVEDGYRRAPMSMRVSPYLISLMRWDDPYDCPLRTQFIPVGRMLHVDHPQLHLDTLHEQEDSPVPGLTHRYADKALFLPLHTCPVYCRFCTRSYAVGLDTDEVKKAGFSVDYARWQRAFAYLASRPEIEDVVISGGDAYNLRPQHLEAIGMTLLKLPNIRRIRFATKGIAIMPQKVLSHAAWTDAVTRVVEFGRQQEKDVVIHTHFSHPDEITWISRQAMALLHSRGIVVRNQAVLLRGVNDSIETMTTLVRRLGYINIHPYYVYLCDMVKGVEDLRTSLAQAIAIERGVRGTTAGFNTPTFVCDAPGGGGKRCLHSYVHYDLESGVSVYNAPSVKPGQFFLYFDPLHSLSESARRRWANASESQQMIDDACEEARRQFA